MTYLYYDIQTKQQNIRQYLGRMGYITKEGLKELDNYKYKSGEYTLLDNLMNYYWEWCVKLVPMWVAPNVLTLIGWCLIIASYANMLRYDYTFKEQLPSSAFFFASFCIFAYSTLDAIDGKQARRTKSGSPLGQLFDHGCDSFSLTFFMLGVCQATRIQKDEVFLIFIMTQVAFWSSNWAEHHTGVLRTKVGQFGVTEGEYTVGIVHLLTGIFGQNFWKTNLDQLLPASITHIKDNHPILTHIFTEDIGTVIIHGFSVSIAFVVVYVVTRTLYVTKERVGAISQFFSIVLLVIMEIVWSTLEIYQKYNGVILTNFGVIASFLICKIIICSVTKMHFSYFHLELFPLIISTLVMLILQKIKTPIQPKIVLFWTCFVLNILLILKFLNETINQITSYLGIYCFNLNKRPRQKIE